MVSGTLARSDLDALLDALRGRGYAVIGPVVRDGGIAYEEVDSAADLPAGWRDEQEGGSFRLTRREDEAVFGHNVGHDSLKRWLFPPTLRVWHSTGGAPPVAAPPDPPRQPLAFFGVRSCDLHA